MVRGTDGKVDKRASVKRAGEKVGDRLTKGAVASGAESVNAIAAARNRMKGTSYTSVDLSGTEVKFENQAGKILYEEFRDKIEKYAQMQEWDANDRKRANLEARRTEIQTVDIPAKQAEIALKSAQIAAALPTIPGTMIGPTGTVIPTQIPNPLIPTLNTELSGLQSSLSQLNSDVSKIGTDIATIRGNTFSYSPTGNSRVEFHKNIKATKLEIIRVIDKINLHIDPTGTIKALPDGFFNPKNLKIEPVKILEKIARVVRK